MSRSTKSLKDAAQLLELSELFSTNVQTVIHEWAKEQEPDANNDGASPDMLPSLRLYEAQRTLLALTGKLTELVAEPSLRIMEVGCQYWESRALYIACERRIPDMLAAPADIKNGVSIKTLGAKTGIEADKLSRILRTLCSNHIFAEPSPDHFTNNVISAALVGNEPLRAYILNFNLDLYAASEHLPKALLDKVKGPSYQVDETAWQDALGTTMSRWDWLEEKVTPDQISKPGVGYPSVPQPNAVIKGNMKAVGEPLVGRPEHQIFNLSMLGGGRVHGAAHPYGQCCTLKRSCPPDPPQSGRILSAVNTDGSNRLPLGFTWQWHSCRRRWRCWYVFSLPILSSLLPALTRCFQHKVDFSSSFPTYILP